MNARCAGALDPAPGSTEKHVPGYLHMAGFEVTTYGRFWGDHRGGNFRFAFKDLSTKNSSQLSRLLRPFEGGTSLIEARYRDRPSGALAIEHIERNHTWCLGYITRKRHDNESALLADKLKSSPKDRKLMELAEFYESLGKMIEITRRKGLNNTDVYLTWDYMDVYVATSMRRQWDFEDVADFAGRLFSDAHLLSLKLRYFDPTQSDCLSRIDKGLVEALMLKRASCTVYLVQESDTLGKDSELASTLAQGKPVIAFVPHMQIDEYVAKIKLLPLEFFKIRFRLLQAEGIFEESDLQPRLFEADSSFEATVNNFLDEANKFAADQPFTLWPNKQMEFKKQLPTFDRVCSILAIAEKYYFDKRASILKSVHPLSLQAHLESGVANGVLVVRTIQECAQLLYNVLTNSVHFLIESDEKLKCTVLKENISQSPFRVVTEYEKLSNSFWNFYLASRDREMEADGQ